MPNEYYPGNPSIFGIEERAYSIPVVVGSVFGEFKNGIRVENRPNLTENEALELLRRKYGDKTEYVASLFKKAYPEKNLSYLMNLDVTGFREKTMEYLDMRAERCTAPTYGYLFALTFHIDDERPAWHSSDLPFVFHNVKTNPVCHIAGVSNRVEEQMAGMWVNMAKYGSPMNDAFSEEWRPYTKSDHTVMIIDRESKIRVDHDRELISYLCEHFPDPHPNQKPDTNAEGRSFTGN